MAPRRKNAIVASTQSREYKVRLPEDVAQRIETKAKAEGRPQNRVIINELAAFPDLEQQAKLGQLVRDMDVTLARYSARIVTADLTDDLLRTLREMTQTDDANSGSVWRARSAKLRVILAEIEKHARGSKNK
ncbi:hypothetical protein [Bradyrhizobium sp. UNPA324]|uniref:hypothetical protein n=1 Tax=Bradyrhizobium sp. UNPA324 TaxID=1141174 RepID=UPI00114D5E6C|nr:hypothetical protein [Bradyrhizobium sp. UNPA324]TQF29164.1 hypothetical protein UNPA324_05550 [Bradyrhizobium sp. UNPA324]TQF31852.1 hypothetical protein UNPA324_21180 [Bradyrhizobium sp. UNPA324]